MCDFLVQLQIILWRSNKTFVFNFRYSTLGSAVKFKLNLKSLKSTHLAKVIIKSERRQSKHKTLVKTCKSLQQQTNNDVKITFPSQWLKCQIKEKTECIVKLINRHFYLFWDTNSTHHSLILYLQCIFWQLFLFHDHEKE